MKKTVKENVQRLLSIKERQHLFNESDFKYYFNKITKNKGNYNGLQTCERCVLQVGGRMAQVCC